MNIDNNSKIKCYFDNNSTTIMPKCVIQEIIKWANMGNPSSDYATAQRCRNLIKAFKLYLAKLGQFKLTSDVLNDDDSTDHRGGKNCSINVQPDEYRIILTSCASESNALIIRSVVDSFNHNTKTIPHIISSQIEHKSIIETLEQLEKEGRVEVTLIPPNPLGFISPINIERAFRDNTALCTIMTANNETGAINDYANIAKLCHQRNIPFHTDAVQIFGKTMIRPVRDDIDAYSVSFHKLHGPVGIGMLVIKEEFIKGYKLCGQIGGTQNCHFRGGTLNITGIAGAYEATKYTMANRLKKNEFVRNLKRYIIQEIAARFPSQMYREYLKDNNRADVKNGGKPKRDMEIVFISNAEDKYLPNTLLLSVVKRSKPDMCNGKLKKYLCEKGIIVSIGSACNTDSDKASHVLSAMNVDSIIKRGTIRISISDGSTKEQCDILVRELLNYIKLLD